MRLRTRLSWARSQEAFARRPAVHSLRSYFPLEIVHHILSFLDPPSLASLARTSFACLQEASSTLYADVELATVDQLFSFTCTPPVSSRSRLAPHLSLAQTRQLTIHSPPHLSPVDIFPHLISRNDTFVPPRLHPLRSPLPLLSLTLTSFADNNQSSDNHPFALLLLVLFPHLAPERVRFWACPTEQASKLDRTHLWCSSFTWQPIMRAWTSLKSLSAVGWYPLLADEDWFLLHYLPPAEPDAQPFELEINLERWSEDLDDGVDIATMEQVGVLARPGLKAVFVVSKVGEEAVRREMDILDETQRARLTLKVV